MAQLEPAAAHGRTFMSNVSNICSFLVTFIHEGMFIFPFCLSVTKTSGLYSGWKLQGLVGAQTEGKTLS